MGDLEAWEAEFGDRDGGSRRRLRWISLVVVVVAVLVLICWLWLVALLNPDNYRAPTDPTPPVIQSQGAAQLGFWPS
jgi:hypothetical protein